MEILLIMDFWWEGVIKQATEDFVYKGYNKRIQTKNTAKNKSLCIWGQFFMTYLKKYNVQQYLFINASKYIDPRQKGLN